MRRCLSEGGTAGRRGMGLSRCNLGDSRLSLSGDGLSKGRLGLSRGCLSKDLLGGGELCRNESTSRGWSGRGGLGG